MLFEPDLAVVRIEEYCHNISRIEVSNPVVLFQLHPAKIEACHKEGSSRLTPSLFKVV
jgi:hypothetical protein